MRHLDEPHPALDQPAGDEDRAGLLAGAVGVEDVLRLPASRRRRRSPRTASGRPARTTGCGPPAAGRRAGSPGGPGSASGAGRAASAGRPARRSCCGRARSASRCRSSSIDVGALEDAGQERRLPVLRLHQRHPAGAHGTRTRAGSGSRCPRPYVTHDPRLGRTSRLSPVFISRNDGSWFGTSACIDRITQMSSMCFAVCSKISLTSMPDLPYFLNLNGDGNAAPVCRSVLRLVGRQRLAGVLRQERLGVERVDLGRAAVGEQVDDPLRLGREVRLARGERVGRIDGPLRRGGQEPGVAQSWVRPSRPMPTPHRVSISRRDCSAVSRSSCIPSVNPRTRTRCSQQHLGELLPRPELPGCRLRPSGRPRRTPWRASTSSARRVAAQDTAR